MYFAAPMGFVPPPPPPPPRRGKENTHGADAAGPGPGSVREAGSFPRRAASARSSGIYVPSLRAPSIANDDKTKVSHEHIRRSVDHDAEGQTHLTARGLSAELARIRREKDLAWGHVSELQEQNHLLRQRTRELEEHNKALVGQLTKLKQEQQQHQQQQQDAAAATAAAAAVVAAATAAAAAAAVAASSPVAPAAAAAASCYSPAAHAVPSMYRLTAQEGTPSGHLHGAGTACAVSAAASPFAERPPLAARSLNPQLNLVQQLQKQKDQKQPAMPSVSCLGEYRAIPKLPHMAGYGAIW
ncbi:hypothetical protein HYH02_002067 [Chlamydomonas schloesseri]|uniref:Uncharacterized protein n=1 Tax=Chlamydomonas schloesseri TaxID=2026947 RepID=A0A836BCJ2_9CHLO|nr:hypothetical protein HYH02_002067 [Chlamydomonas schloesseri]|eukprot:KAG2453860.1 hypothetical protein HYH02_002067 [Chlamydomonas schloesseri]